MYPKASGHSLEAHTIVLKSNAYEFAESEAIEPSFPAKAREAGFGAGLDSAKEPFVCVIQSLKRGPLQIHGQCRSVGIAFTPLGESLRLIDIGPRQICLAVGINPLF